MTDFRISVRTFGQTKLHTDAVSGFGHTCHADAERPRQFFVGLFEQNQHTKQFLATCHRRTGFTKMQQRRRIDGQKGVTEILFFLTGEQVGLQAFHHAVKFARVAVARLDIRKLADKGAVAFVQVLTGGYQFVKPAFLITQPFVSPLMFLRLELPPEPQIAVAHHHPAGYKKDE